MDILKSFDRNGKMQLQFASKVKYMYVHDDMMSQGDAHCQLTPGDDSKLKWM